MSWPQAITLSVSIVLFAAGVVFSGLSAHRDNERRMIQEAATAMCSATSEVIAQLKAIERKLTAGEPVSANREELERVLPAVAAAHGRFRLAAGTARKALPPENASDWSHVLTRITIGLGNVALTGDGAVAVLRVCDAIT